MPGPAGVRAPRRFADHHFSRPQRRGRPAGLSGLPPQLGMLESSDGHAPFLSQESILDVYDECLVGTIFDSWTVTRYSDGFDDEFYDSHCDHQGSSPKSHSLKIIFPTLRSLTSIGWAATAWRG